MMTMPARMILALMLGMLVLPACQQDEPPPTAENARQDDQDEPPVTTETARQHDQDEPTLTTERARQDDQDGPQVTWESYSDAGLEAQEQARYAEAEQLYLEALKEAGKFGEQDPRLPTSLNNLASLYYAQGKYAEAETLSLFCSYLGLRSLSHGWCCTCSLGWLGKTLNRPTTEPHVTPLVCENFWASLLRLEIHPPQQVLRWR